MLTHTHTQTNLTAKTRRIHPPRNQPPWWRKSCWTCRSSRPARTSVFTSACTVRSAPKKSSRPFSTKVCLSSTHTCLSTPSIPKWCQQRRISLTFCLLVCLLHDALSFAFPVSLYLLRHIPHPPPFLFGLLFKKILIRKELLRPKMQGPDHGYGQDWVVGRLFVPTQEQLEHPGANPGLPQRKWYFVYVFGKLFVYVTFVFICCMYVLGCSLLMWH